MSTPEEIEARASQNYSHPRVTLDAIHDAIATVYYTTGERIAQHAASTVHAGKDRPFPPNLAVFTLCMVVMKNGFIVTGQSAPASVENFKEEIGRKNAYDNCIKQMWVLMGFALRDVLHHEKA
jgi:hypothetical protein